MADSTLYLEGVVAARKCYCHYGKNSTQYFPGSATVALYNYKFKDLGNDYNPATGIFTAPTDGIYQVNATMLTANTYFAVGKLWIVNVTTSAGRVCNGFFQKQEYARTTLKHSTVGCSVVLDKAQTVTINVQHSISGSVNNYVGGSDTSYNYLTIARVREL